MQPRGEGLAGGVALILGGLLCCRCAGEEGVEEVADDGLLLESSWFNLGGGSLRHKNKNTLIQIVIPCLSFINISK